MREDSEKAAGRWPKRRDSDTQSFDVPPPPKGELVFVLLPKRLLPPVFEPKMLPEFVLEPKPGDAGVELEMLIRKCWRSSIQGASWTVAQPSIAMVIT